MVELSLGKRGSDMTLFEYYLQYMTEVFEGKRQAPEGITLTAGD